ncbi:helix-turn-helix transcriptional regulator [Pseudonocardia petroleophila]|uniref:Helix-turn-helix domain-containing protein n=1 Tax=Pseudonocardia petroleophila TaxID=37331 RepID=A0A7G7MJI9_9PSEU|nr:helix-turn-helix transcriptional regulator [Pseudonocardia petroleophila]QNG52950.1 helix-turn-helix domain-containing protein [Pseudonocardia petroleophila]
MDRTELGAALRTWRERLRPEDVGLPAGFRRRTPGLRREEVAQLAGVSTDYLTRLEQARGPNPSESVVAALARALRVTDAEREHLYRLAGASPPGPGRIRSTVRPSVQRLLDRFTDLPALLLDAKTDVLLWNPMAAALLGDFSALPPAGRNMARAMFTGPFRDEGDPDRERLDRAVVSDLRRAATRYPDDPDLRRLVTDLRAGSPVFARLWDLRELDERHGHTKTVRHRDLGPLLLDCNSLSVDADDQRLLVYSAAPGTPAADALDLLRVVGLQRVG